MVIADHLFCAGYFIDIFDYVLCVSFLVVMISVIWPLYLVVGVEFATVLLFCLSTLLVWALMCWLLLCCCHYDSYFLWCEDHHVIGISKLAYALQGTVLESWSDVDCSCWFLHLVYNLCLYGCLCDSS